MSSSISSNLDTLASPPVYTEAEESTAAALQLDGDSVPAAAASAQTGAGAEGNQAPSYQISAQGGDTSVLGGPPPPLSAVRADPRQQDDLFFDIAPGSDATSFQVGYLGLDGFQAWIKGDVLLKLGNSSLRTQSNFYKAVIELRAVESIESGDQATSQSCQDDVPKEVELFYSSSTLWDATAATSSTAPPAELPTTMPFSFPLTQDLPHCVHLPKSRLAYTLRATLHSSDTQNTPSLIKVVPVHLTRYSTPGPLADAVLSLDAYRGSAGSFGLDPHTWKTSTPTEMYVQLERTLFRRSEPMGFRILIPALPDRRLMTEKSLSLRAVEADLVRIITVLSPSKPPPDRAQNTKDKGKLSEATEVASRSRHATEEDEGERVPSYTDSMDTVRGQATHEEDTQPGPSTQASSIPHDADLSSTVERHPNRYETLLAHSGKLCRFSTHRAVNLRLTLHPPFSAPNMPHPHPDHDAFAVAARSASMYVRPGSARDSTRGTTATGSGTVHLRSAESDQEQTGAQGLETAVPGSLAGGSGCESITQETLLHRVRFEVRVRIALDGGPAGRRDVRFVREVRILPGAAGEAVSDRSTEAGPSSLAQHPELDAREDPPSRNPEKMADNTSSSSGKQAIQDGVFANFNDDEEYDGYEDVLQDVEDDDPPPGADDVGDESICTVGSLSYLAVASSSTSEEASASHARAASAYAEHPYAVTRSPEGEETGPPPTLQQSQHDLQLEEVEVEGVGFAVPRRTLVDHNEDAPGFYDTFPPPITPSESETFHFESIHAQHNRDPPPPPSPPLVSSAEPDHADFPPPPMISDASVDGDPPRSIHRQDEGERATGQAHEPPPYLADDSRGDRPPSFHAQVAGILPDVSSALSQDSPPGIDEARSGPYPTGPQGARSPVVTSHRPLSHGHGDRNELPAALPPAYAQPPPLTVQLSHPPGPPSYSVR
ncbi:unnamed protein product [Tilletia controversa]|uniref:Uncharacterized protein n=3 Tax=Tilletia TaxID=13289 RepID=A0A8X7MQL5_9BASI|nr:hypothetical protein CF336_g5204 [Tilletia laevis]KAE8197250.1 hypothetical protein CF328_g3904 [Tilletia controversa]KAE8261009.1 hypothetical protein A4X03_0g3622 [Tilletia caries]KAE8197956.1 hypothetical protein CF335_g4496 [Tilletia laevis]KAE8245414.1 hypothetical protein A4X06_0g5695 [Tilletia controversa]